MVIKMNFEKKCFPPFAFVIVIYFPMQELITLCQSMTYGPCAKNLKPFLIH